MSTAQTSLSLEGDILIVDDNLVNLGVLKEILIIAGYQVRPASDGELALRSAAELSTVAEHVHLVGTNDDILDTPLGKKVKAFVWDTCLANQRRDGNVRKNKECGPIEHQ